MRLTIESKNEYKYFEDLMVIFDFAPEQELVDLSPLRDMVLEAMSAFNDAANDEAFPEELSSAWY